MVPSFLPLVGWPDVETPVVLHMPANLRKITTLRTNLKIRQVFREKILFPVKLSELLKLSFDFSFYIY